MRVYKCKGCGKYIAWIRTAAGKSMPVDPEKILYIEQPKTGPQKIVTDNGQVLSCEYTDDPMLATGAGYIPHWATCTGFKKRRQARETR